MPKVAFTEEDDVLLMKYIATYNPQLKGRLGVKLYETLVRNAERKWSFSSRHSAQSWRERYKTNQPRFDAQILKYQKKHDISGNPSDNPSSRAPLENGAKKRLREVDSEDRTLDDGVVRKMRKVSIQASRPCGIPPHTRPPSADGGKAHTVSSPLPCPVKGEVTPAIGPDDYTGALSGSGESDQEVESQSKRRGTSESAVLSRQSSPANEGDVKPPVTLRKSPSPTLVGATASGELSPSHQQRDRHTPAVDAEAPVFVRKPVVPPLQLSQEPTPPHTSAINSPCSPLPNQPSPTRGASSQAGNDPRRITSFLKPTRKLSSRKRIGEDDDIFSTPPPQAVQENSPRRIHAREAPHLVEGSFRSAYANASGNSRLELYGRRVNGTDEAEADGEDEDWPPRRGKQKLSKGANKGNSTPLREHEDSTVDAHQGRPPSSAPFVPNTVSVGESKGISWSSSSTEPTVSNENVQAPVSQTKAIPLHVVQVVDSTVAQTSRDAGGPLQPATTSHSQDRLLHNLERSLSPHGSVQAQHPAQVASRNRLFFPAVSAHKFPPPVPGPPSKRASLGQYPNSAAYGEPSMDDPFTVPLVNRKARRWTLAVEKEIPPADTRRAELDRRASVQHIDLRALQSSRSAGTFHSGSASSRGRSNSSGVMKKKRPRRPHRASTPPNLSQSNKELVLALGLETVYSRMAENHKFHIDVVREVAAMQRSLEDVDRVLRGMREAAEREYVRMLRQEEPVYSTLETEIRQSEDDEESPGDEEDDQQPMRPSRAPFGSNHSPTPQGRTKQLALKITTESPVSSPPRPPHYSPPTPTRAHEFRRLERQGRGEEARLREARRVRRSLWPSSGEASPEVDEQRIATYLLQLQEDGSDGVPGEEPWDVTEPEHLEEQAKEGETQEDEGGVGLSLPEGHADADTKQPQGNGPAEEDFDALGVIVAKECQTPQDIVLAEGTGRNVNRENVTQAPSSLAGSALATLSLLDTEWTNSDDELLLDGDLVAHEELVKRKGLGSVKFRIAHMYGLLLDA